MNNRHYYRTIVAYALGLAGSSALATFFLIRQDWFAGAFSFIIAFYLLRRLMFYIRRINRLIAAFLLGIENEDTTLKMPARTGNRDIDAIFQGLERLNELFRQTKIDINVQEQVYLSIIKQSATGLFSVNEAGRIIHINPAAEQLTGIIAFHHLSSLERINKAIPAFIGDAGPDQDQNSQIFDNGKGQKLLFKVTWINTPGERIRLVAVSDITKELDMREVDAWIKLARTLSHEIMNNIAPITTLSQVTLGYFLKNDQEVQAGDIEQEVIQKTIKGLSVIEERSSGLKKFVEHYRKFTGLPEPDFRDTDLVELLKKVRLVCSGLEGYGSTRIVETLPETCPVRTDQDLLSHVLINVIKNALESFSTPTKGTENELRLRLLPGKPEIRLDICNNGEPIPPEIREQIFIPFFTTREGGTGIGLSLSKQIMLKLGGDISLGPADSGYTCFSLSLQA
jgi:nitrogen fixation/metabolism regulation signal transduction histidine kinase